MKVTNINTSNDMEFFSDSDKENFYEVVGNSIEALKQEFPKYDTKLLDLIYSNRKYLDVKPEISDLNIKGLHVYRSLLANNIYQSRNYSQKEEIDTLNKKGILIINNFLSDKEFKKVEDTFLKVKQQFPDGKHIKAKVNNFFNNNLDYLNLIKECAHVKEFSDDTFDNVPRSEFWYHKHESNDPQYNFHSDTFHPTIKCWLYIEDIAEEQGPFQYIPFSNLYTKTRMIWDYENSNMKPGDDLWSRRIESNGNPGSFRIYNNSPTDIELKELKRMGYKTSMSACASKNTLVIANTFGYHKRGIGKEDTFRSTLTSQYRPVAFRVY